MLAFVFISMLMMQTDLVIYEMNVRSFTADESSGLDPSIRGSYLGVISKVHDFYFLLPFTPLNVLNRISELLLLLSLIHI